MASNVGQPPILARLDRIDRRWIFLAMFVAVAAPILWVGVTGKTFPEAPTPAVQGAFDAVECLPESERGEYRRQLEQLVFAVRDEDGTWDDRVFPRSRSFGTAMALMGLMRPQAPSPATWKAAAP